MNGDADAESPPGSWLRYAEIDLVLMRSVLNAGGPAGEVCFHAQQATEKALKGLLESQQVKAPYSHDLVALHEMAPATLRPGVNMEFLDRLTELEAQSRYPGEWPEPSGEEALWASDIATTVVRAVNEAFSESAQS